MMFFLSCNVDIGTALVNKIRELNGGYQKQKDELISKSLFKENSGLNSADYREFAEWLLSLTRTTSKELNAKMNQMKKMRLVRWNIYVAPDDVVVPDRSV